MQSTEGRGKVFVFPKYLIPDTNEFIDHMTQLVQLVECGHFVLAVPLTGRNSHTHHTSSLREGLAAAILSCYVTFKWWMAVCYLCAQ